MVVFFVKSPLRVLYLLWKFTAVLHFTVQLYEFKLRIVQSFSKPLLQLYSLPYVKDTMDLTYITNGKKKSDVAFLSSFFKLLLLDIIVILIRNCALQFCSMNLYYLLFFFSFKKNRNVYLRRGNLFIYYSNLPSDWHSHMFDSVQSRKIYAYMRFWISYNSYIVANNVPLQAP